MSFIKKQSVGFYFAALAVIAAVVATVFYLINCNTAYFSNLGVNAVIVGCLIVAIVLELVYIIGYNKVGVSLVMDVLPLVCGALMMVAFAQFITARVNSIATILSFERNAQTMSDLSSAIIGMICCFVAILLNYIGFLLQSSENRKNNRIHISGKKAVLGEREPPACCFRESSTPCYCLMEK